MCTLSSASLQKSRATLQDFVLSIFMFHDLLMSDFLCFMDVLFFVEASLYEVDEICEEALDKSQAETRGEACASHSEVGVTNGAENSAEGGAARDALVTAIDSNEVLANCVSFLKERKLFDSHVEEQFRLGLEYWALEQQLCSGTAWDPEILLHKAKRAISLKSFDYRVLHLLLYGLTGRPRQALLTEWLDTYITLVEIEDDLKDYHKDIKKNSFNIFRMFVRVHGSHAPEELSSFIALLEKQYIELRDKAALDPALIARHIARNEEQCGAGPVMAPTNGGWQIPQPVLDERAFCALSVIGQVPLFVAAVNKSVARS
jgi:hypothetical protein